MEAGKEFNSSDHSKKRIINGSLSNKWKVSLKFNGITNDNKIVVSGYSVFKFIETKGVSLDNILMILDKDIYVIDWIEFIHTSVIHDWKLKGTLLKIKNSLIDIYGKEYSNIIINKLNEYCEDYI